MSQNKRKSLMIKRPSPDESGKHRPLPKVNISESAAGATETSEIKPVASQTSKIKTPQPDGRVATARISLPDEAKIRKARRADGDQTLQINPDALRTAPVQEPSEDSGEELQGNLDQTMEIDAEALQTTRLPSEELEADDATDLQSRETMRMEHLESEKDPHEDELNAATAELEQPEEPGAASETGKINETFNAMTMAMDPNELARELAREQTQKAPESDLTGLGDSEARPKTILIKRPSSNEPPAAPTVKTVRPDAQTVRTSRPEAGEGPAEGKTVKLRRPGGSGPRPGAPVSRLAATAGLEINEEGQVSAKAKAKVSSMGAGWLALSILTLVIVSGALWITLAIRMPELPMPGRIVNEHNQILSRTS